MTRADATPLGIAVGGSMDEIAVAARAAEEAGFESVWVAELERSAIVQAAAVATATSRATIGTGVALAFPRSPTILAMDAWDLDELSGGRFMLGIGTQVKRVLEGRFSVPFESPAARLSEYAAALRTVWAANRGDAVTHEGRFYRITMPTFHGEPRPARDVPILFAAVGPGMARAAGSVADGLIGHPLATPRYLAQVVAPALIEGLGDAGRAESACPITATAIASLHADAGVARRRARLQVAFYATTRTYRAILELHGRGALIGELRRAFVRRDEDRMAELVDDELLDTVAIAGTPDEARDRLDAWAADLPAVGRVILAPPWYLVPPADALASTTAVIRAFGR